MKLIREDLRRIDLLVPKRLTAVRLALVMIPLEFMVRYPQGANSYRSAYSLCNTVHSLMIK